MMDTSLTHFEAAHRIPSHFKKSVNNVKPINILARRLIAHSMLLCGLTACSLQDTLPSSQANISEFQKHPWYADAACDAPDNAYEKFAPYEPDNLWHRIRDGYGLGNYNEQPRVAKHLKWYLKHPKYFERVTQRGSQYLYYITEQLDGADMPLEIALLPVVESAFDPFAYSHGRAAGLWQFIPGTGKRFGLEQNWWYDGRRDVYSSTQAARDYLTYLNKLFDGDWLLALAAYNTGEGNLRKAIRRNKKQGKPTDFWSLDLPRETEAYVPQLLALSELILHHDKYQQPLPYVANAPYFERVNISSQLDLNQAAELADMDMDALYRLNPAFNRWATPPEGPHYLLIPVDKSQAFQTKLAQIPTSERVAWQRYTIKSGDSLSTIAQKYNTTSSAIKQHNNLKSNQIRTGKKLLIPTAMASNKLYSQSANERLKRKQDRSPSSQRKQKTQYKVQSGDSLWKIAKAYNVSVSQLAKWNGMAPKDPLRIGQKLVVWHKGAPAQANTNSAVVRKVHYRVRSGDSLSRIASRFKLSVKDIQQWNNISSNSLLHPGDAITLFVDVTRQGG